MISTDEKFWSQVDIKGENDCWPFLRGRSTDGYGSFYVGKAKGQSVVLLAHRVAYMLTHGDIRADLLCCHHCDNPPCCNPKHLFEGTKRENAADMIRKGRYRKGPPTPGESNPASKLTESDVRQIAQLLDAGEKPSLLAKEYAVSPWTIRRIGRRETWKHVFEEESS